LRLVIDTYVDVGTRPPVIAVRLRIEGKKDLVFRPRRASSAAAATLAAVAYALRLLDEPTRVDVEVDDEIAANAIRSGLTIVPPWLRHIANTLDGEVVLGSHMLKGRRGALSDDCA
jgi:hypothetical protein